MTVCAEINVARQGGSMFVPRTTRLVLAVATKFSTKVLIRPVSLHGILGRPTSVVL